MANIEGKQEPVEADTWTIMLYLSGDNNLSSEMVRALADITLQGVPKGITFTVQYDPQSPGFKTFRYAIKPADTSGRKAALHEAALEKTALKNEAAGPLPIPGYLSRRLKTEDSTKPSSLTSFIRWSSRQVSPRSKYRMLILSGHGSGAVGDFLTDNNARGGRPGSLTIPGLAKALRKAKVHIDVLGMDSCLMGMAEVGYQVRQRVGYLVGSEGFLPNAGWPYSHLLKKLGERRGEGMDPASVAKRFVQDTISYYKQYIPAGVSFDMSSCDLTQLEGVASALGSLTQALNLPAKPKATLSPRSENVRDLVITAHWRAQSYKFEQHTDLWDFCDQLEDVTARLSSQLHTKGRGPLNRITKRCQRVKREVAALTGKSPQHTGPEFQHSHGLAVFFPWSTSNLGGDNALRDYGKLAFPRESGWARFLNAYLICSERGPRKEDGALLPNTKRPALAPSPGFIRHADTSSKHADTSSKHADTSSKFADLITRLYTPGGMTLPWSMKNPPQGVRWPR